MRFVGEPLAPVASSDDVLRVAHGRWPVESCSQSFGDEGATACVVAADALVDILEYGLAVMDGDASL